MIELVGKYTTAKIFAETIEEGVYSFKKKMNIHVDKYIAFGLFLLNNSFLL